MLWDNRPKRAIQSRPELPTLQPVAQVRGRALVWPFSMHMHIAVHFLRHHSSGIATGCLHLATLWPIGVVGRTHSANITKLNHGAINFRSFCDKSCLNFFLSIL